MTPATKKETAAAKTKSGFPTPATERSDTPAEAPPPLTNPDLAAEIIAIADKVEAARLHEGVKRNTTHRLRQAAAELNTEGV